MTTVIIEKKEDPSTKGTSRPDTRFKCWDCKFKTLYEGGATEHSKRTKHFVSEAPIPEVAND